MRGGSKMKKASKKRPKYEKPRVLYQYEEKDFVTKELPFVGATSNYKTYIPIQVKNV